MKARRTALHFLQSLFYLPFKFQVRAMSFQGRIVARLLPPGLSGDAHQSNTPLARQIDPVCFKKDGGPLHYRPNGARFSNEALLTSLNKQTAPSSGDKNDVHEKQVATFDVYLFGNGKQDPVHIRMNRESEEAASKMLKRMELSCTKKLLGRKAKGKHQQPCPTSGALPSIWKFNSETHELMEEFDCRDLSNRELVQEAMATPLALKLPLTDFSNEPLHLLIESCPPTVSAVQTFEDFQQYLFVDVPIVIEVETLFTKHCQMDWYVDGKLVEKDSYCFVPRACDVGKSLAILLTPIRDDHNGQGCEEAYQFQRYIEALPDNHILDLRPDWTSKRNQESSNDFRVVSYNVLSDQNVFEAPKQVSYIYASYVTTETIQRCRRLPLVWHEIWMYQPDVVCLQEVDEYVFERLFQPVLEHFGFQGYYSRKTGEGTREGCAVFWSLNRFEPVSKEDQLCFELSRLFPVKEPPQDEWTSMYEIYRLLQHRPDLSDVVGTKLGHVAQLVPLVSKDSKQTVWVCNTHIFFHPLGSHVRLMQVYVLCRQLARELERRPGSIVLCGDLNSSLTNSPGRLLVERHVPMNYRNLQNDLNDFVWEEASTRIPTCDDFPEISLPGSFPRLRQGLLATPTFTHFIGGLQGGFLETLDHILISDELETISSAPMPTLHDVSKQTAMPSENLPSDHVSLVCDLAIKKGSKE